jgi:alpha-methylacyl-CoA racemase
VAGVQQPAPAPRFSRTPPQVPAAPPERGAGGRRALADWGFDANAIERLTARGLGAN